MQFFSVQRQFQCAQRFVQLLTHPTDKPVI
jgi:hypothetical protein